MAEVGEIREMQVLRIGFTNGEHINADEQMRHALGARGVQCTVFARRTLEEAAPPNIGAIFVAEGSGTGRHYRLLNANGEQQGAPSTNFTELLNRAIDMVFGHDRHGQVALVGFTTHERNKANAEAGNVQIVTGAALTLVEAPSADQAPPGIVATIIAEGDGSERRYRVVLPNRDHSGVPLASIDHALSTVAGFCNPTPRT